MISEFDLVLSYPCDIGWKIRQKPRKGAITTYKNFSYKSKWRQVEQKLSKLLLMVAN